MFQIFELNSKWTKLLSVSYASNDVWFAAMCAFHWPMFHGHDLYTVPCQGEVHDFSNDSDIMPKIALLHAAQFVNSLNYSWCHWFSNEFGFVVSPAMFLQKSNLRFVDKMLPLYDWLALLHFPMIDSVSNRQTNVIVSTMRLHSMSSVADYVSIAPIRFVL